MRWLCYFGLLLGELVAGVQLEVNQKKAEFSEAVIDCQLHGRFLIRNMELAFFNGGAGAAEGELVCPLDEGERVVSFAMEVNGKRRSAVVVPAKRGRIAYEEIVAQKVDPGLLEVDEEKGEFRTRVFPILAQQEKRVWMTTVQPIDEGEVVVWPEGFGIPEKWELVLESRGGVMPDGGSELQWRSGVRSEIPGKKVAWVPGKNLVYLGGPEPVRQSQFENTNDQAGKIEIWLDGTVDLDERSLGNLKELLGKYREAEVSLLVFREKVGEAVHFSLENGQCPGLFERISEERPHGMARPRELPFESVGADVVILVTDGEFVFGPAGVGVPSCVLHVVDSGEGKSEWLWGKAKCSGGGWHGVGGLDQTGRPTNREAVAIGDFEGSLWEIGGKVKEGEQALESPISKWIWAVLESQRMENEGAGKARVDEFRTKHGVLTSGASLLVLETARQYLRYGFDPPADDRELVKAYQVALEVREAGKKGLKDRFGLIAAWKNRCDLLETPIASVDKRLSEKITEGRAYWRDLEKRMNEITPEMLDRYDAKVEECLRVLQGGVGKDEVKLMMEHLDQLKNIDQGLRKKVPRIMVAVGGQVKRPGSYEMKAGITLMEAVSVAGGETPFGAMNRVKLFRHGKVYTYDLRNDRHKGVKLYEGDMVDVPQKSWMGNGGSEGRKKAPFTNRGASLIKIRTGEWSSSADYLKALNEIIPKGEPFWERYQELRKIYGWRPDFYLDVIEMLEKNSHRWDAGRVAGDLAELMPGNAEVLGKAARVMRRLGRKKLAAELYERTIELEPEGVAHRYELARTLGDLGRSQKAVDLYVEELKSSRRYQVSSRTMVILEELNALMARTGVRPSDENFPDELIRHVPVELRAVLEWDADQANVDLVGRDPIWTNGLMGEKLKFHSGNVIDGYGPESSSMVGVLPGRYALGARFYGDWKDGRSSTVTAEVEIVRNFGAENERRERHAVRLSEKEEKTLVEIEVFPREWE